jgi:hypothetical protein
MTDSELQELADLWQEADPAEVARFERFARRARRQGRLLAYADLALALLIVAPLATVPMTPHPTMIAVALLLLLATGWVSLKRRRLRQLTATLNTSDPAAFLESSIQNTKADLRRVRLTLMLMPLFVGATILFKGSQRSDNKLEHLPEGVWAWASSPRGLIALTVVAVVLAVLVRSRRRLKVELRRLERLRLEYEEENRRDDGG